MQVAFRAIHNEFGKNQIPRIEDQPPKKNAAKTYESANMFPYSAKKKRAKAIEEYSMLYPATISAYASGRSKGVRFVSAKIATKKIIANGRHGTMYHIDSCDVTIETKFAEPDKNMSVSRTKEKKTSYEIICADERKAPRNAYFELLDHTDKITA
jgi:hypothetical protein